MKQNFIERNYVAVFKTLQVVYIILAGVEAFDHELAGFFSNLVFVVAIEVFIKAARLEKRKDAAINLHIDYYKLDGEEEEGKTVNEEEEKIGNEVNPNLSPDQCRDEIRSLAGRTIREPHKCDNCPNETAGCKKLILAGGDHICVI